MIFITQPNGAQLLGPNAYQLMGLGGGNPAVQSLQNSLKGLAQVTGRTAIDPGPADGIVGVKTMSAIIAGFNILAEKLSSDAATAIKIGLVIGGMTPQAQELVTRFASQLDIAAKAATLKYATGSSSPAPTPPAPAAGQPPVVYTAPSPTVAWLKTPMGIGVIALGVVGTGFLLFTLFSK